MFLVNNLLFVLFTFTVLIGTVFPLVVEAVQRRADERGPARTSTAWRCRIGVALLLLMGVGPALPWGRATAEQVQARAAAAARRARALARRGRLRARRARAVDAA